MPGKEDTVASIGAYQLLRDLGPELGLGADASLARRNDDPDTRFLAKQYSQRGLQRARVLRELRQAKLLTHPAGSTVADYFEAEGKLVAVFQVDDGLSLETVIAHLEAQNERLSNDAIWYLARQLFGALAETHELKDGNGRPLHAAHGHLAPNRVHLSWDGRVHVIGLAVPSLFSANEESSSSAAYLPPEHKPSSRPSARGDLYRAALIVWTLLTGRRPKAGAAPVDIQRFREDVPDELAEALDTALQASALRRTTSCRSLEQLIASTIDSSANAAELTANMELFRDLDPHALVSRPLPSEAAVTLNPRTSDAPDDEMTLKPPRSGRAKDSDDPRASDPGARVRRDPLSSGSDDSTVRRLSDLFDALPVGAGSVPPVTDDDDEAWLLDVVRKSAPGPTPAKRPSAPRPTTDADAASSGTKASSKEVPVSTPEPITAPRPAKDLAAKAPPEQAAPTDEARVAKLPGAPAARGGATAGAAMAIVAPVDPPESLQVEDEPSFAQNPRLSETEVDALEASIDELMVDDVEAEDLHRAEEGALEIVVEEQEVEHPRHVVAPAKPASPPPTDAATADSDSSPPPQPVTPPVAEAPATPAPAAPELTPAPRAKKRRRSWLVTAAGALVAAVVAVGAAWMLKAQRGESTPPAPSANDTAATQTPGPSARPGTSTSTTSTAAPVPTSTASAATDAGATDDAADAGSETVDAATEDAGEDSSASGDLPAVIDEIGEATLLSYEGFLTVRSRTTAEVFVQGVLRGLTNHKLKARCHQKNVRLRSPDTGRWITEGEPVRITCMDSTTVVINP